MNPFLMFTLEMIDEFPTTWILKCIDFIIYHNFELLEIILKFNIDGILYDISMWSMRLIFRYFFLEQNVLIWPHKRNHRPITYCHQIQKPLLENLLIVPEQSEKDFLTEKDSVQIPIQKFSQVNHDGIIEVRSIPNCWIC